jgi:hypothetical protein
MSAGADAVSISYSSSDGRYTVSLPDYQEGILSPNYESAGGWLYPRHTGSDLLLGEGPETQPVTVILERPNASEYSYTSFGMWSGPLPMGQNDGFFAYGIPTSTGEIPVTGTANYSGEVRGTTNGEGTADGSIWVIPVGGSVDLSFNFGAGTLSGEMRPFIVPWDAVPLGTYTFRDTLYSTGSLSFSGAFIVPGSSANSSFSGNFTGPQGAELMANWLAPFQNPTTGLWGMMGGVWVAKKGD